MYLHDSLSFSHWRWTTVLPIIYIMPSNIIFYIIAIKPYSLYFSCKVHYAFTVVTLYYILLQWVTQNLLDLTNISVEKVFHWYNYQPQCNTKTKCFDHASWSCRVSNIDIMQNNCSTTIQLWMLGIWE